MLCIWSHLLAQSAGNRGHADKYGTTVGMGEPGISNFFQHLSQQSDIDWSLLSTSEEVFKTNKHVLIDARGSK